MMKKMGTFIAIILIYIFLYSISAAGSLNSSQNRNFFAFAPASVYHVAPTEFVSPAGLALPPKLEQYFFWSTDGSNSTTFKNWGYSGKFHNFGLGIQRISVSQYWVRDYSLSMGVGNKSGAFGIGYSWSVGDRDYFERYKTIIFSALIRPFEFVSFGLSERVSLEKKWNETSLECGLRPLGSSVLTIFGEAALENNMTVSDMPWSIGGIIKIVPGVDLIGRYFDDKSFRFGLSLDFGTTGVGGRANYNRDKELTSYTYHLRSGALRPSIIGESLLNKNKYLPIQLKGTIDYTKYILFDNSSLRFFDILENIKAAIDDKRIGVLALNLSGMRIRPEQAWEIRNELAKVRAAGKRIFVFIDNARMTSYYLASIADQIVLDPIGSLILPGFASSRTYFKGTLDKLGIGFDEWRFFEYKSAAEQLSRDSFSMADREQNQQYIDDRYEAVRADICEARGLSENQFDSLIDNQVYFSAELAIESGLVDTVGRWSDAGSIISDLMKQPYRPLPANQLYAKAIVTDDWSERQKIAIVYGLGDCAMDYGINARWLERLLLAIAHDYTIKAVVFRVDSPGGDGMASDLVAQAIKKCSKSKPVIISQGQVAASGGYWISTYGNKILAGPSTVTGSIGVIGGWVYDRGIGDKTGISGDFVKRGEHADFSTGLQLPFIGLSLPSRNLTSEERSLVEEAIEKHYEDFKSKVAEGRGMSIEEVEKTAQGRFYSGVSGKKVGLVDEIGGLYDAIEIAREEAGINSDTKIEIVEFPKYKGLFDLKSKVMPSFSTFENDPVVEYIKLLLEQPNHFLPMMTPGSYPDFEN
ncbi:MAG: signal peptide peptidase SppA [Candidatus Zixiibacteriota bacterium]